MRLVNPQNTQIHDILLVLAGKYIPYGKDLGLRFKLILFVVLYHARESPWGRLMGGFPDAVSSIQDLKSILLELIWLVEREDPTPFTHDYSTYITTRLEREKETREIRRTLRAGIEFFIDAIEGMEDLRRSYSDDNRIDPQLAEYLSRMITWDISGVDIHQENRELRELLAVQIGGMTLYRDDGELSDSSAHPSIDFRRDTPTLIKRAIIRRNEIKREKEKQT